MFNHFKGEPLTIRFHTVSNLSNRSTRRDLKHFMHMQSPSFIPLCSDIGVLQKKIAFFDVYYIRRRQVTVSSVVVVFVLFVDATAKCQQIMRMQ